MSDTEVSIDTTTNTQSGQIRSAIDSLLSFDSVKVSEPTVQLTECSPDVDVVMNKQGGICTNCNTLFKSKVSLVNHRCIANNSLITTIHSKTFNTRPPPTFNLRHDPLIASKNITGPRLVIVPNN